MAIWYILQIVSRFGMMHKKNLATLPVPPWTAATKATKSLHPV
jgi:hypothetical protein